MLLILPHPSHRSRRAAPPAARRFFALTTGANLVLLGSLQLSPAGLAGAPQNAVAALGVSAVSSLANWLFIEPKTTGLMFERYAIENKPSKNADDEAEIKRLYKQFGM